MKVVRMLARRMRPPSPVAPVFRFSRLFHTRFDDEEKEVRVLPSRRRRTQAAPSALQATCKFFHRRRVLRPLYDRPNFGYRRFSAAAPTLPGNMTGDQINEILHRDRFREVVEALSIDTRVRISCEEFSKISQAFGVKLEEVPMLQEMLSKAGIVLDFSADYDMIIIKPEKVLTSWEKTLDLERNHISKYIKRRQQDLIRFREEIKPLEQEYLAIEKKCERYSVHCMRFLFGYALVHSWAIVYLTFWLLSWDIMEPITYLINLFSFITAVYFFNSTNCDFTFDAMKATMRSIKRQKLYKKTGFQEAEYKRLKKAIFDAETDLLNPEWFVLNEVANEMGSVLPDPDTIGEEI